jgi:hypothetical protein
MRANYTRLNASTSRKGSNATNRHGSVREFAGSVLPEHNCEEKPAVAEMGRTTVTG